MGSPRQWDGFVHRHEHDGHRLIGALITADATKIASWRPQWRPSGLQSRQSQRGTPSQWNPEQLSPRLPPAAAADLIPLAMRRELQAAAASLPTELPYMYMYCTSFSISQAKPPKQPSSWSLAEPR